MPRTRIGKLNGWERRILGTVMMSLLVIATPGYYSGVAQHDWVRLRRQAVHYRDNVRLAYRIAVLVHDSASQPQ